MLYKWINLKKNKTKQQQQKPNQNKKIPNHFPSPPSSPPKERVPHWLCFQFCLFKHTFCWRLEATVLFCSLLKIHYFIHQLTPQSYPVGLLCNTLKAPKKPAQDLPPTDPSATLPITQGLGRNLISPVLRSHLHTTALKSGCKEPCPVKKLTQHFIAYASIFNKRSDAIWSNSF